MLKGFILVLSISLLFIIYGSFCLLLFAVPMSKLEESKRVVSQPSPEMCWGPAIDKLDSLFRGLFYPKLFNCSFMTFSRLRSKGEVFLDMLYGLIDAEGDFALSGALCCCLLETWSNKLLAKRLLFCFSFALLLLSRIIY